MPIFLLAVAVLALAPIFGIFKLFSSLFSTEANEEKTTLDEQFNFPTASQDRLKPKVYGSRWISAPNIVDYGKYSTRPVMSDEVYDD